MASSSSRIASFERPATWALSVSAARLCLSTNLSVEMSLFMTPGMSESEIETSGAIGSQVSECCFHNCDPVAADDEFGSCRRPREGPCHRGTAHVTTRRSVPGKHQTCSVPRLQCSTQPLPVHLLDGPTADLQELGQFPLAHPLRPLHLDVLPLLLAQAGPPAGETPLGPRLRLAGDRAVPDRVTPPLAEGEHHRELELAGGRRAVSKSSARDRNSTPAWCRPSITCSP